MGHRLRRSRHRSRRCRRSRNRGVRGLSGKREVWEPLGRPGIFGGIFGGEFRDVRFAEGDERGDVEAMMCGGERRKIFYAEREEARGGAEAASILGVVGPEMLFLQMDEGAGDLDEAFEKGMVGTFRAQPELLEDIVGFVVFAAIKAGEETRVVRVEAGGGLSSEGPDVGGDAVAFFHRVCGAANLSIPALCKTSSV